MFGEFFVITCIFSSILMEILTQLCPSRKKTYNIIRASRYMSIHNEKLFSRRLSLRPKIKEIIMEMCP